MATQKKLEKLPYQSIGKNLARPGRTIKMVKAICPICSNGIKDGSWVENCPHDPFFTIRQVEKVEPKYEVGDDGRKRVVGEDRYLEETRVPNLRQVSFEEKVNSGRSVEKARARGMKLPEELGYAPMCQFNGCWSSDIKYRTQYGDYCTEVEAKLVKLRVTGRPIVVSSDADALREQLSGVSIS